CQRPERGFVRLRPFLWRRRLSPRRCFLARTEYDRSNRRFPREPQGSRFSRQWRLRVLQREGQPHLFLDRDGAARCRCEFPRLCRVGPRLRKTPGSAESLLKLADTLFASSRRRPCCLETSRSATCCSKTERAPNPFGNTPSPDRDSQCSCRSSP